MNPETLRVLLLLGEEVSASSLMEILPNLPQVEVLGQINSPQQMAGHPPEDMPDLLIVDLGPQKGLPEWLGTLGQYAPQTAVLVCSNNRDPDFLIRVIHAGVREFVPLPVNLEELETALQRIQATMRQQPHRGAGPGGQMVVVTGLKGGMGVTSVAVNLAVALAGTFPKRVVLVDLGRPFPDVAAFLDQKKTTSILDLIEHGDQLDSGLVFKTLQSHHSGLSVLHGCENLELVDPKVLGKILTILRPLFDWIVIDLSHFLDNLNLAALQDADQVLIVTDLLVPNLENLKKWWSQYDGWHLERDKAKVIVNRYQKNEGVTLEDLQHLQNHPVFYTLPSDYFPLSESINHGLPIIEMTPRSKLSRALQELAAEVASLPQVAETEAAAAPKKKRFWFF
jgi:pilus assembly protein CpaE